MQIRRLMRSKKKRVVRIHSDAIELQEWIKPHDIPFISKSEIPRHALAHEVIDRPIPLTCSEKASHRWHRFKEWAQDLTFKDCVHFFSGAVFILTSTAADTSSFAVGLQGLNRPLLYHIPLVNNVIIVISIAYFLQSLMVNGPEIAEGINKSIRIIDKRELPAHWEKFSKKKEFLIGLASLIFTFYSSTCEALATYGFFSDLNWRTELNITISTIYFVTNMMSEGRKTWENFRNKFCTVPSEPEHRCLSKILGYTLAMFSAAGAIILGYDGLTSQFGTPTLPGQIALLTASIIKGYSDISYSGAINMGAMDDCINEVEENRGAKCSQIVSILIASYIGSLVADSLAVVYYTSLSTAALPFTIPLIACSILGYGIAISQGLTVAYGLSSLLNPLTAYFCQPSKENTDDNYQKFQDEIAESVKAPEPPSKKSSQKKSEKTSPVDFKQTPPVYLNQTSPTLFQSKKFVNPTIVIEEPAKMPEI